MKLAKDDLIAALRLRYDYYSAQTMFDVARDRAGLADQAGFDAGEVTKLRAALDAVGDRLDRVQERIDYLLDPASAAARTVPAEDPPKAAKPAEAPKAAAVEDKDADDKHGGKDKHAAKAKADGDDKHAAKDEDRAADADDKHGGKDKHAAKDKHGGKDKHAGKDKDDDASDAKAIEATIALTGVEVKDGEEVLVCGGLVELGDWDPKHARPMARKGAEWITTIHVSPGIEVSFKFLRRTSDGKVVWESGEDRTAVAKPRLEAVWR